MGWILDEDDGTRIYDEDAAFLQSIERALCTERGTRIGRPDYGVAARRFRQTRRNNDTIRELSDEVRSAVADLIDASSLDFEEIVGGTRVTINGRIQVVLRT